jgi:hypothetical protein
MGFWCKIIVLFSADLGTKPSLGMFAFYAMARSVV